MHFGKEKNTAPHVDVHAAQKTLSPATCHASVLSVLHIRNEDPKSRGIGRRSRSRRGGLIRNKSPVGMAGTPLA